MKHTLNAVLSGVVSLILFSCDVPLTKAFPDGTDSPNQQVNDYPKLDTYDDTKSYLNKTKFNFGDGGKVYFSIKNNSAYGYYGTITINSKKMFSGVSLQGEVTLLSPTIIMVKNLMVHSGDFDPERNTSTTGVLNINIDGSIFMRITDGNNITEYTLEPQKTTYNNGSDNNAYLQWKNNLSTPTLNQPTVDFTNLLDTLFDSYKLIDNNYEFDAKYLKRNNHLGIIKNPQILDSIDRLYIIKEFKIDTYTYYLFATYNNSNTCSACTGNLGFVKMDNKTTNITDCNFKIDEISIDNIYGLEFYNILSEKRIAFNSSYGGQGSTYKSLTILDLNLNKVVLNENVEFNQERVNEDNITYDYMTKDITQSNMNELIFEGKTEIENKGLKCFKETWKLNQNYVFELIKSDTIKCNK